MGVHKAFQFNFFSFPTFNVDSYEKYEMVEHGDFNWIVQDKILAFAGPQNNHKNMDGYICHTPNDYIPYFKRHNVKLVIRLNRKYYDENKFTNHKIGHLDLYFTDGSTPSPSIVSSFIAHSENTINGFPLPNTTSNRKQQSSSSSSRYNLLQEPSSSSSNQEEPRRPQDCGAIAVHCKAGLGRTGFWMY